MRSTLLVARREYAENAATKGFWIGIFLFPVLILLSIQAQVWLERATPTRDFVLVDQSGEFEEVLAAGLERLHQRDVFRAFVEYAREHAAPSAEDESGEIDLEKIPADLAGMLDEFAQRNPEALEAFVSQGGLDVALRELRPHLAPEAPEFEPPKRRFRRAALPADIDATAPVDELVAELKPYLRGAERLPGEDGPVELFAAVVVPADVLEHVQRPGAPPTLDEARRGVQYWAINLADDDLREEFEDVFNDEVRRREYVGRGMDAAAVDAVQRTRVPFSSLDPKKEEGEEEVSLADVLRQWAPVGFVYLLWIGIFSILQMLLNNTIEEKSNRIIEVLLSSVTAGELMMGKLVGIAGIGLTMLGCWIGSLVLVLSFQGEEAEWAAQLFTILKTSGLLPAFAVYFLLGYLMYAGIFLAIGSVCNTLKEAQNLMGPVMMIMIVPLFTMMFIPKDPNGTLATVMSWIPLYTPFVMMNRAAADPPLFDVVGTFVLLAASTALALWLSGRVFRIGILRTGQPPKLLELFRWVRHRA